MGNDRAESMSGVCRPTTSSVQQGTVLPSRLSVLLCLILPVMLKDSTEYLPSQRSKYLRIIHHSLAFFNRRTRRTAPPCYSRACKRGFERRREGESLRDLGWGKLQWDVYYPGLFLVLTISLYHRLINFSNSF